MDSLRKIFHDGDTDGSGELDMDELHALICKHQAAQWDLAKGVDSTRLTKLLNYT